MAITIRSFTELYGKEVFTDKGMYCGRVADVQVDLRRFRVRALIIEAERGTYLSEIVGGKKGVILPYQFVSSIGDVIIIKHIPSSISTREAEEKEEVKGSE